VLDDEFAPVEESESFFIQHRGIEFAGGLIEYKGDLLVSYGVPDRGGRPFAFFLTARSRNGLVPWAN
jgi:hypothetical protein